MSKFVRVKFSELCEITRGASPRPIIEWISLSGIPWVKISDATKSDSKYIDDTNEKIKNEGASRSVEVFPGDLILSNSATPGIPRFMRIHACIHDGWLLLRNFRNIDKDFCYYLLLAERNKLIQQGNGSIFTNLKIEILKNHVVNLPPIPEQRAIAEVLSSLDEKIELNRRMNRTLEQLAQAIYKHMFVDNPEREGWGTKRLGEIADVNWGDTNTTKASYVTDGFIAFSAKGPDGYLPYYDFNVTGVVLSAIGANSGMTWLAQGKWSCIKNTIRFWSTSEEVSTEYLFMATFGNEKWPLRGSAQPFISQTDARNMLINVPEKGLAKKFGDLVNPLFSQMDHNTEQNKVLAELRDTLLPKLMSGQVRVNGTTTSLEQDR